MIKLSFSKSCIFLKLLQAEVFIFLRRRQDRAPLFEALVRHNAKNPAGFHIPGHRQGQALPPELGERAIFAFDLTELPGLDDLHNPHGPIAESQALAAEIYGADRSFFLVNGTSVGIQALLTAQAGNREVIVPRNVHRSVLGGLVIAGADPVYVLPEIMPGFEVDCGVPPLRIRQALEGHPGAAAVLAVCPNFYGVLCDLDGQASAAHEADKPVLVDEAHGAHLRFHPGLPEDAMAAGADAAVQSTHKLGGSLGQSSILHLKGEIVDSDAVAAALRLLQTTSPSYLLMVSLDLARRQLAVQGEYLLDKTLALSRYTRERLAGIKGLRVLTEENLPEGFLRLDPTKLVISVRGLGLTGFQVSGLLARRYHVFVEMADACNIVAFVSIGSTREECDALASALEDIAARDKLPAAAVLPGAPAGFKKRMKPREAWFARSRQVPLAEARGRISAETVAVYPPGIPAVNPGEEITAEIHEYLTLVSRMRLPCQGMSDPALKSIKIVIE